MSIICKSVKITIDENKPLSATKGCIPDEQSVEYFRLKRSYCKSFMLWIAVENESFHFVIRNDDIQIYILYDFGSIIFIDLKSNHSIELDLQINASRKIQLEIATL